MPVKNVIHVERHILYDVCRIYVKQVSNILSCIQQYLHENEVNGAEYDGEASPAV